ncbi:MAG: UDP-N-acetylmuramoyl-L-alanine--D-glutamate ligase [Spirochaetaceae bacterium]|nr:MAG: UDP-N-acetylmuramoyl-L-alanine--D-glutamate ligase [Spirochaetaceae bacterium]
MSEFHGKRVTVIGLGLHGGGSAAARYFASRGATVTVTDLRDESVLATSCESLSDLDIRYVLGRHDTSDFESADIVVKNPAVRRTSPYLAAAARIVTDISVFLDEFHGTVIAVTGTKGKSTTASAIHHALKTHTDNVFLGGNITVSPLSFIEETDENSTVVLELSSFQLGDLAYVAALSRRAVYAPHVALITNIHVDHLDYYGSMESYVADKRVVFASQSATHETIVRNDSYGAQFARETRARVTVFGPEPAGDGAFLAPDGTGLLRRADSVETILPAKRKLPGEHNAENLLAAALAVHAVGMPRENAARALAEFPGIEHRMEFCADLDRVAVFNDSAATIPEATLAAVSSFDRPVVLITGGNDKNLAYDAFTEIASRVSAVYLLDGTATPMIRDFFAERNPADAIHGPYSSLDNCVSDAVTHAPENSIVLFSPGCTSFGMFANEFDRGRKFKRAVEEIALAGRRRRPV